MGINEDLVCELMQNPTGLTAKELSTRMGMGINNYHNIQKRLWAIDNNKKKWHGYNIIRKKVVGDDIYEIVVKDTTRNRDIIGFADYMTKRTVNSIKKTRRMQGLTSKIKDRITSRALLQILNDCNRSWVNAMTNEEIVVEVRH